MERERLVKKKKVKKREKENMLTLLTDDRGCQPITCTDRSQNFQAEEQAIDLARWEKKKKFKKRKIINVTSNRKKKNVTTNMKKKKNRSQFLLL